MRTLPAAILLLFCMVSASQGAVFPQIIEVPIATAAISGPTGDPALANYRCFDLVVNIPAGSTDRFNVAGVYISLSQGSFYAPEFGEDTPPNSELLLDHLNLRYDTYVTVPGYNPAVPSVAIPGRFVGPGAPIMPRHNEQQILANIAWGQLGGSGGVGVNPIARFTISRDAVGTFTGQVFSYIAPTSSVTITESLNGTIDSGRFSSVPEPSGAMAVLLLAGMARRSRSTVS